MVSGIGTVCGIVRLNIKIMNICKNVLVFVIRNFHYDCLVGLDLIKKFRSCQNDELEISQNVLNLESDSNVNNTRKITNTKVKNLFRVNSNEFIYVRNFQADLDHLDSNKKKIAIEDIINHHKAVFVEHKFDIGTVSDHEASIKLIEGKYISTKPYRCSIEDQKETESQIYKLLAANLIKEFTSPHYFGI